MYNNTPFKTPLPYRTPKSDHDRMYQNGKASSDSEESIASTNSDNNLDTPYTPSSNGEISLLAEFDDIIRIFRLMKTGKLEGELAFLDFVEKIKFLYKDYFEALDECKRLQMVLDDKIHECSDLEHKLAKARKLIDQERHNVRAMRKERNDLANQIHQVRELLFTDKGTTSRLSEDVRHKLSFLNNNNTLNEWNFPDGQPQLSIIKEVNSTGSMLSDFSYSRSEDDLDGSFLHADRGWKKHRASSSGAAEPAIKKRRSSGNKIGTTDTVRATTTVTVSKDGPILATSIIESIPQPSAPQEPPPSNGESHPSAPPANLVFESWARQSPCKADKMMKIRQHNYQAKVVVTPYTCGVCKKRINFAKTAMKCKECKTICHMECKDDLPLPCIPSMNTPTQRNGLGLISDYTPTTPPMVPALLIHCINEIELRGLNELGIYRIPGAERDVKGLKEKFLKGRVAPCLSQIDIHVICGTVKDFLRSLHEPILTYGLRKKFVQAVEAENPSDIAQGLYQAISELPQSNRDTLAYMILHLQKVAQAKECKMNVSNLAKCFGPTIVGYTSDDPNPNNLMNEIVEHNKVMEYLLELPFEYWSSFVNVETTRQPSRLQQTPSTDSLLRSTTTKGLFQTPNRNLNLIKRKQKYFASPKH